LINPIIFEREANGNESYHDIYSRLVKDRVIFIAEAICQESASIIAATLLWLNTQDSEEPISLYINCEGGEVEAGLFVIYDMMNLVQAPIRTYCIGEASSAAAVILAAGTKGERYALPNSRIMIHEVQASDIGGSGTDIENQTKSVRYINKRVTEILARHVGKPHSVVMKDCKIDRYMSAEEALEYGIIDHIIQPNKKIPDLVKSVRKSKKEVPVENNEL